MSRHGHGARRALALFAAACVLMACARLSEAAGRTAGGGRHDADLVVPKGDTLTVKPGSVLEFAAGAGVRVEGSLVAAGAKGRPVVFKGASGPWAGIRCAPGSAVTLKDAEITGAADAVKLTGGTLKLDDTLIRDCERGITVETLGSAEMSGLTASGVAKDAVYVKQGSRAVITRSRITGPGKTGVRAVGNCDVKVGASAFSGLEAAIRSTYPGSSPEVADTTFRGNTYGVYSEYPEAGARLTDCAFEGNTHGVYAKRLSSPSLEDTRITGSEYGIYATEGASPSAEGCVIAGNVYGVYVTFSSYPRVNRSDLSGNAKYAAYLDEQSYEWVSASGDDERRRNMGMRAAAAGSRGGGAMARGQAAGRYVNPKGGYVDFTGNYWGADALAEMKRSEALADVGAIYDYFDLETDVYEGKRWVRDKVDYSGYLTGSPAR